MGADVVPPGWTVPALEVFRAKVLGPRTWTAETTHLAAPPNKKSSPREHPGATEEGLTSEVRDDAKA